MGSCWVRGGLIVLGVLLVCASRVSAGEDPEALIRQGVELRRTGDNVRAQGYFARAYQLARTPRSAAQLGLVELALGDFAPAEEHLSEALRASDAWVKQNQQTLEQSRDSARKQLLRAELVGAPPGATAALAGRTAIPLPADGVLWLAPGTSTVKVAAPGREAVTLTVAGEAGQTQRLEVALPASGAAALTPPADISRPGPGGADMPAPAAETPPGRNLRIAGISTAAAGVVAGVVGIIVHQQGNSKRDAIEAAARDNKPYNSGDGNFETLQQAGVGLMIGGAVAAAGGAALYLVGRRAGMTETTNVSVFFRGGPGGGVLTLGRRF